MEARSIAVVDDAALTNLEKLTAAIEQAWAMGNDAAVRANLQRQASHYYQARTRGISKGAPTATDPGLVEGLIDALHANGFPNVAVGSAPGQASGWAENRSVAALADLLGYRFVTPEGRDYEIVDLSEQLDFERFPAGTSLEHAGLSRAWGDADFRIVFAKSKSDEADGGALGLVSLFGVLPLADKRLHYRTARSAGEVIADLLDTAPVHFAIIDATTSTHGSGGQRLPMPIETGTVIASASIVLADQSQPLRWLSTLSASNCSPTSSNDNPIPERYSVRGSLQTYPGWSRVSSRIKWTNHYRASNPGFET